MDVEVVVEIVKSGRNRYNVDRDSGRIYLDRHLYTAMCCPADYGSVQATFGQDGNPVHALVLGAAPTFPGTVVRARVVGMMTTSAEAGGDDMLLTVPTRDRRWAHVKDIGDVAEHELEAIAHFFTHHTDLQPAAHVQAPGRWAGAHDGEALLRQAAERYRH